jgi:hypothetical protein
MVVIGRQSSNLVKVVQETSMLVAGTGLTVSTCLNGSRKPRARSVTGMATDMLDRTIDMFVEGEGGARNGRQVVNAHIIQYEADARGMTGAPGTIQK